LALSVFLSSLIASAATPFNPTTTLSAETSNNTSAAASFTTQSNGNIGGANISKVSVHTLLYAGSTSKVYAQFLPWFGFGDHMNVGYTSTDIVEIQKQVADMISRGVDGAIIDWYGRGTSNSHFVSYDQASQELMREAEKHPGFSFAIQHDAVALKNCGCDVTQTLIDDLNFANRTYQGSSAYLSYNGRPVFFFFGHEAYPIDWNRVRASVAGNPLFIFRNPSGFNYAQSNGGFSWVEPGTSGYSYLDGYYSTALATPAAYSIGSAYKGFDDSLAAWGSHRFIAQQCGQTFLQSMAEVGKYYSSADQMLGIQMVTWNDYEEGTEMETGIDNCVNVSASSSGSVVSWSISGQMNTVDHFSVFASQDGQNLMWLADENTSVSSLDLATFGLPAGNYTIFVKAIGKPMLSNKMSPGVQVALSGTTPPADFSWNAPSGSSATIKAGQMANYSLQLDATGGPFSVAVTCSGAPTKSTCTAPAAPIAVTPGTPANVAISVTTTANAGAALPPGNKSLPPAFWLLLLVVPAGLLAQMKVLSPRIRRFAVKPAWAALALLAFMAIGCGGKSASATIAPNPTPTPVPTPTPAPGPANGTPSGTYTVVVTATSGSLTHTEQLTLTVQ
jgi:hypothetical protein